MRIGIGWALLGLPFVLAACGGAAHPDARVAAASGCQEIAGNEATAEFYTPGRVYAARKLEKREIVARAIQRDRVVGAELYLHAPRNVTSEFMERALICHSRSGQAAHPNDPLHPSDGSVRRVSVRSAGGSLAVQVEGDDLQAGREIWARARAFASGSNVEVRQVAAAGSDGAL
jgi:hypothetical protein